MDCAGGCSVICCGECHLQRCFCHRLEVSQCDWYVSPSSKHWYLNTRACSGCMEILASTLIECYQSFDVEKPVPNLLVLKKNDKTVEMIVNRAVHCDKCNKDLKFEDQLQECRKIRRGEDWKSNSCSDCLKRGLEKLADCYDKKMKLCRGF